MVLDDPCERSRNLPWRGHDPQVEKADLKTTPVKDPVTSPEEVITHRLRKLT